GQAELILPTILKMGIDSSIAEVFHLMGPTAKDAVPALVATLREGDHDEAWAASDALCKIGPQARAAIPVLVDALKRPQAAQWAVKVLQAIGPEAVPALIQGLHAPDAQTREFAADALGRIGPDAAAALNDLTGLLQEKPSVRLWAAIAIACIQP